MRVVGFILVFILAVLLLAAFFAGFVMAPVPVMIVILGPPFMLAIGAICVETGRHLPSVRQAEFAELVAARKAERFAHDLAWLAHDIGDTREEENELVAEAIARDTAEELERALDPPGVDLTNAPKGGW